MVNGKCSLTLPPCCAVQSKSNRLWCPLHLLACQVCVVHVFACFENDTVNIASEMSICVEEKKEAHTAVPADEKKEDDKQRSRPPSSTGS